MWHSNHPNSRKSGASWGPGKIIRRIPQASEATRLAAWGEERLHCSQQQLIEAVRGTPAPRHQQLLGLYLRRLHLVDEQSQQIHGMIAQAMQAHQDAVVRLAEVPGLGADSAQQVIAEVGVQASTFPSAAQLTAWVGTCPGRNESAADNQSSRSAKGNKFVRRVLTEAAQAAVRTKGSHFQLVFRRLLPRLVYKQALWAIAHRLCRVVWKILHEGLVTSSRANAIPRPVSNGLSALRKLGYKVEITPLIPGHFTYNSNGLNILLVIFFGRLLFSIFCGQHGEGGNPSLV